MTTKALVGRDRAIDVLRGWAIVLMISSHIGSRARVAAIIDIPLWFDAASPFVLLSGLVLGMTARAGKPFLGVWKRARQIWAIHVVCMVVVLVVHETTGRLIAPSVAEAGGLVATLWKVPTLRLQALDYMNILPLFVVFFAVAPLLVIAMRRRWSVLVAVGSLGLWLVTQRDPGWLRFTDRASGPEAFVLPAWQLPFVIGLTLGFHASALGDFYRRHRTWLVPTGAVIAASVFVTAQLQRRLAARLGLHAPESVVSLFSKETWGPGRALYTLSLLGLAYLGVDWLVQHGHAERARPLELLGRRSLYCFLVHLPLALLASGLDLNARPVFVQDLAVVTALVVVYLMARYEVLARYIPT